MLTYLLLWTVKMSTNLFYVWGTITRPESCQQCFERSANVCPGPDYSVHQRKFRLCRILGTRHFVHCRESKEKNNKVFCLWTTNVLRNTASQPVTKMIYHEVCLWLLQKKTIWKNKIIHKQMISLAFNFNIYFSFTEQNM